MTDIRLRPYQQRFIADVRNEFRNGFKRVVGVAPCGAGKIPEEAFLMKNISTKTWERVKKLFAKMRQFDFALIVDATAEMHSLCDFVLRLMDTHEKDAEVKEAKDYCRSQIKLKDEDEAGWARCLHFAASNRYNSDDVLGTCSTTHDLSNCTFNKLGICVFVNYLLTEGSKTKDRIARYLKHQNLNVDDFIFFGLPDEKIPKKVTPSSTNFVPSPEVINITPLGTKLVPPPDSFFAEAKNFFNQLYARIPANNFAYLIKFKGGTKIFSFDVSDETQRIAMVKKAVQLSESGVDVWHSVNPVSVKPTNTKRGDETVVSYQTAIVVDIDIAGDAHKNDNLAADFDEAKSFLPFTPSFIIDSGYGLHAYYLFDEPIKITDQNREELKRRNNLLLDVIRQRSNGKAIDGVGDLPRILRTPSTFNYKLGKDNAPICHVVEDTGLRFSPNDLDERLNAIFTPSTKSTSTTPKTQQRASCASYAANFFDDTDFNLFRARRMLDFFSPSNLTYDEWLAVGMALKNIGCDCSDWEQWSRADERFKVGECERKWNGFNRNGYDIGTLYTFAKLGGYDAKDTYRQWYDLNPNFRPSAKRDMDEKIKHELDDAIIWLDTLEPENFTADDAHNPDNLRAVALAKHFGYSAQVEKFFVTIKAAKEAAQLRLADAKSSLSAPLSKREELALNALVEGVNIKSLRNSVDREVTDINRSQKDFYQQQKLERKKAAAIKHAKEREQTVEGNIQKLIDLRAEFRKNPSSELAKQIQNLILHSCDVKIDRHTGKVSAVKATQANTDLIFSFDPMLDGLFGYDQFQQADVFLKAPLWNQNIKRGDEWTDRDDNNLQTYIRRHYIELASDKLILKNITSYSDHRAFHEVKDFFRALPTWDGKPRAEKLFIKFLGAEDSPYVREVTLNILTAAVARIFHPGCDYQLAPILLGEQGIGKSYLLDKLGGKWYGSLVDDVGDPHAIDAIQKLWLVEIKEMAAMKKDIDANKRFIDSARDTRRFAFNRRAQTVPRHCVFLITTNNKECLTDMTGNRRYPIIQCHSKPRQYVEGLTDNYIKQVWAEVFAHYQELFKDGFDEKKLALSREAQIQSDEIAQEHLADDGMESEIRSYLDTRILPLLIWYLLTREERRDFIKNGRLVMLDAITEFNHRRRARGGKQDTVQRDVDAITSCLTATQKKFWLRIEQIKFQGRDVKEYTLYGSELRQHICAVEIYNECFGNDRRKSPTRINEILNRIDGWSLGARIQKDDPAYLDQKKVFYRND